MYSMTTSDKELSDIVKAIYDSDENPLAYMIEPKGSVEIADKNTVITRKDLENIL